MKHINLFYLIIFFGFLFFPTVFSAPAKPDFSIVKLYTSDSPSGSSKNNFTLNEFVYPCIKVSNAGKSGSVTVQFIVGTMSQTTTVSVNQNQTSDPKCGSPYLSLPAGNYTLIGKLVTADCSNCGDTFSFTVQSITCSKNSDCGIETSSSPYCSSNAIKQDVTTPICSSPGTPSAKCTSSMQTKTLQQCSTSQVCENAQCKDVTCSKNSDCGTSGWTGTLSCSNNDVHQNYISYTCNNAGAANAFCSFTTEDKLKEDCSANQICADGACKFVLCSKNSDCGTDGFIGTKFCKNGDVMQQYKTWTCNSAGTSQAFCSNSLEDKLVTDCTVNETCSNGSCALKSGCQYDNPSCGEKYDCISNQCVLKQGFCYKDSDCSGDEKCINEQCKSVPKGVWDYLSCIEQLKGDKVAVGLLTELPTAGATKMLGNTVYEVLGEVDIPEESLDAGITGPIEAGLICLPVGLLSGGIAWYGCIGTEQGLETTLSEVGEAHELCKKIVDPSDDVGQAFVSGIGIFLKLAGLVSDIKDSFYVAMEAISEMVTNSIKEECQYLGTEGIFYDQGCYEAHTFPPVIEIKNLTTKVVDGKLIVEADVISNAFMWWANYAPTSSGSYSPDLKLIVYKSNAVMENNNLNSEFPEPTEQPGYTYAVKAVTFTEKDSDGYILKGATSHIKLNINLADAMYLPKNEQIKLNAAVLWWGYTKSGDPNYINLSDNEFGVTIPNALPTLSVQSPYDELVQVFEGGKVSINIIYDDVDGQPIELWPETDSANPEFIVFNKSCQTIVDGKSCTFEWIPKEDSVGNYHFEFGVVDASGGTASKDVYFDILENSPVLKIPAEGESLGTQETKFTWKTSVLVSNYTIKLFEGSENNLKESIEVKNVPPSINEWTYPQDALGGLLKDTYYWWQVIAHTQFTDLTSGKNMFFVDCWADDVCGQTGFVGDVVCGSDGDLYQNYQKFTCESPETLESKCITEPLKLEKLQDCQFGCLDNSLEGAKCLFSETCNNGVDDDGDGTIDYLDEDCEGKTCGNGKVWMWSDMPENDETPPSLPASWFPMSCCQPTQCTKISGACFDFGTFDKLYVCGNNNDWDVCKEATIGNKSDDGKLICTANGWKEGQCATDSGCPVNNSCKNNVCVPKQGCQYNNPSCNENEDCKNNECVLKKGCAFNNPSCAVNEDCKNNTCVLKQGCLYNNPSCGKDYDCKNNECVLKTGCKYSNPLCGKDFDCINNECTLKQGCSYNNPSCGSDSDCVENKCVLKKGCNYNNPSCGSDSDCVENKCVLKKGCSYNNPVCSEKENCVNNTCVLKNGCAYDNPKCGLNEECINNECTLKQGCAYNNPKCKSGEECKNNVCVLSPMTINLENTWIGGKLVVINGAEFQLKANPACKIFLVNDKMYSIEGNQLLNINGKYFKVDNKDKCMLIEAYLTEMTPKSAAYNTNDSRDSEKNSQEKNDKRKETAKKRQRRQ